MGELRAPREADQPESGAHRHAVAAFHLHRALAHVAILGLPAAAVINPHAVAAVLPAEVHARDIGLILNPVPHADDRSGGGSNHPHTRPHRLERGQGEICAAMAVIGEVAAGEIPHAVAWVTVSILLDIAGLVQGAVHWQTDLDITRGGRKGRRDEDQGCQPH